MIHSLLRFLNFFLINLIVLGSLHVLHGKSLQDNIKNMYLPDGIYVPPTKDDLEKAKKLFHNLFRSLDDKDDLKAWNSLGFEIEKMGSFLIVRETESNQTGKGLYIFNTNKPSHVIIEAPHYPSDLYTGTIALHAMEEEPVLAAAFNTVHRKKVNFTAELMTYFNAFTEAFGKAYPTGTIIQLHGFNETAREKIQQDIPDLILSAATRSPPAVLYQYGECLKKLPLTVSLFPRDIKILGGVKNINAKKFRDSGTHGLFLHLEMGKNLREKLKNNKGLRKKFFECFIEKGAE